MKKKNWKQNPLNIFIASPTYRNNLSKIYIEKRCELKNTIKKNKNKN